MLERCEKEAEHVWKADLPPLTDMMCVIYEYSLDADIIMAVPG